MAKRPAAIETTTDAQPPAAPTPPVPPLPNVNGSGGEPLQDAPGTGDGANPQALEGEHIPGPTPSGSEAIDGAPPIGPVYRNKGGRPKGVKNRPKNLNPEPPREPGVSGPRGGAVNYQALGVAICDTVVGIAAGTMGQHWNYAGPEERTSLTKATARYLEAKQIPDIPPGWLLAIAISAYALPRINHPDTVSKLRRVADAVRSRFGRNHGGR